MSIAELFGAEYVGDRDTDTHRVCSCCGELKPVEEFYRDGKDSHGNVRYRRDCKGCYKNQRYLENKRRKEKGK